MESLETTRNQSSGGDEEKNLVVDGLEIRTYFTGGDATVVVGTHHDLGEVAVKFTNRYLPEQIATPFVGKEDPLKKRLLEHEAQVLKESPRSIHITPVSHGIRKLNGRSALFMSFSEGIAESVESLVKFDDIAHNFLDYSLEERLEFFLKSLETDKELIGRGIHQIDKKPSNTLGLVLDSGERVAQEIDYRNAILVEELFEDYDRTDQSFLLNRLFSGTPAYCSPQRNRAIIEGIRPGLMRLAESEQTGSTTGFLKMMVEKPAMLQEGLESRRGYLHQQRWLNTIREEPKILENWQLWGRGLMGIYMVLGRDPFMGDSEEYYEALKQAYLKTARYTSLKHRVGTSSFSMKSEDTRALKHLSVLLAQQEYLKEKELLRYRLGRVDQPQLENLEEKLHGMLSEPPEATLEEAMDEARKALLLTTYPDMSWPERILDGEITRREAVKRIAKVTGSAALIIGAPAIIINHYTSLEHKRRELLNSMYGEGSFPAEEVKEFARDAFVERVSPALARAREAIEASGNPKIYPSSVKNGRYQLINDDEDPQVESWEAAYFPEALLLDNEITSNPESLEFYKRILRENEFDPNTQLWISYALFAYINPRKNLSRVSSRNVEFGELDQVQTNLNEINEFLVDKHIRQFERKPYFIINRRADPTKGYQHMIAIESAYLIRHLATHPDQEYRELFNSHMEVMEQIQVHGDDGKMRIYDMVSFNNPEDFVPHLSYATYDNDSYTEITDDKFYQCTITLALATDLFNLWNSEFGRGGETLAGLNEMWKQVLVPGMEVRDYINAPEETGKVNNHLLAYLLHHSAKYPGRVSHEELTDLKRLALMKMRFDGEEGILPNSRGETWFDSTYRLPSDYMTMRGLLNE